MWQQDHLLEENSDVQVKSGSADRRWGRKESDALVTAFVPSEMACLESSPGRIRRTEVWISRDEMVLFLLYDASLEASPAEQTNRQRGVSTAFTMTRRGRTHRCVRRCR